jgi:hypothetical protein
MRLEIIVYIINDKFINQTDSSDLFNSIGKKGNYVLSLYDL